MNLYCDVHVSRCCSGSLALHLPLANSEEAKMGILVFVCPISGREVFTGLEIDPASFQGLPKLRAEITSYAQT